MICCCQGPFYGFSLRLLSSESSEERIFEKYSDEWGSGSTYVAVASSPFGGFKHHLFVQFVFPHKSVKHKWRGRSIGNVPIRITAVSSLTEH